MLSPDGRGCCPQLRSQFKTRKDLQAEIMVMMPGIVADMKSRLSQKDRHVLFMRFIDGRTVNATARVLGVNMNVVKARQSRGLKRLRKILDSRMLKFAPQKKKTSYVREATSTSAVTGMGGYIEWITLGDLSLSASSVIEWRDQRIELTPSEFKVFRKLLLYGRANVKELYRAVHNALPPFWNEAYDAIEPLICRLRKKLPRGLIKTGKKGSREYFVCREALT